jgi:lipopolysaccharide/colanic/teichoic acid biosynthesis glycosyltransferase
MRRFARLLMVVGVAGILLGARAVHLAVRDPSLAPIAEDLARSLVPGIVLLAAALAFGLPAEPRGWQSTLTRSGAAALVGVLGVAALRVVDPDVIPRFVLLLTGVALVPWYVVCCRLAHHADARHRQSWRVVAVVDDREAGLLETDTGPTSPQPEQPFTLAQTFRSGAVAPLDVLAACEEEGAALLVLGIGAQRDEHVLEVASVLHRRGVRVRTLEAFYDEWLGKLPVSELDRIALMTDVEMLHTTYYAPLKRTVDLVFGGLGVVLLALALPVVAVGNVVANRGPLLYRQRRVGLDEREFTIWKFRTMHVESDQELPAWTTIDDPRITPFGRLLRRSHLDELPQALNILRGTLSVVGPRPEQPHYVSELEDKLPHYAVRHLVKPGLTGWAQVKFRYAASTGEALEKLQYDLYYLRHQSLLLDARIIARTARTMLVSGR